MIGVHDIGGYHHPVPIETTDDTVFHSDWEALTFALLLAASTAGSWSLDEFRHEIEKMPPGRYLETPYYVHWLHSMEQLCLREGWFTSAELETRQQAVRHGDPLPSAPPVDLNKAKAMSEGARGIAYIGLGARKPDLPRHFAVGDRIRARQKSVPGHTRLPWFTWNKPGVIVAYSGTFPLPDSIAHRQGESPEPVYAVRFEGTDLWGEGAEPGSSVTIDLWESYMDHIEAA